MARFSFTVEVSGPNSEDPDREVELDEQDLDNLIYTVRMLSRAKREKNAAEIARHESILEYSLNDLGLSDTVNPNAEEEEG